MTARVGAACALLVAIGFSSAAGAQAPREFSIEAGALRARQVNRDAHDAAVIGVLWRESGTHLASLLSANASYSGDSTAAGQVIGALAYRPSMQWPVQTELGIAASRFGVTSVGRGGNISAYIRQRVSILDGGVWLGGAMGSTDRDDVASHANMYDGGVWYRVGAVTALASISSTRTDDTPLMEAAGIFPLVDGAPFNFSDATVTARYEGRRFSVDASYVSRAGSSLTLAAQSAVYANASWMFNPRVSLLMGAGRQLADPVRGSPDVNYAQASLRFAVGGARAEPGARGVVSFAHIDPQDIGAVLTLSITAPDSMTVEVAGSFSDWQPVPLRKVAGGWELSVALKPGRYRVAVRYDGGAWRAPGSLAKVRDEFGGESGLVVIP